MTEPSWVERQRADRQSKRPGQIRHKEGEKLERCQICFNLGPYCSCSVVSAAEEVIATETIDYCGCCGNEANPEGLWCDACIPHVGEGSVSETYPCPFQV